MERKCNAISWTPDDDNAAAAAADDDDDDTAAAAAAADDDDDDDHDDHDDHDDYGNDGDENRRWTPAPRCYTSAKSGRDNDAYSDISSFTFTGNPGLT